MRNAFLHRRLCCLLTLALAIWLVRHWVWMPVLSVGNSMEPALRDGQLTGVNKLAYRFSSPQRGDVVVVSTGQDWIIKRIVGLPGENVAVRHGIFYVNDRPLEEPYVQLQGLAEIAAAQLDQHSFVIAGDNRSVSFIAVTHRSRIVGRLTTVRFSKEAARLCARSRGRQSSANRGYSEQPFEQRDGF